MFHLVCGEVRPGSYCLLVLHEINWDAIFLHFLQVSTDLNPARISQDTLSSRSSEIDFIHISKITMNCISEAGKHKEKFVIILRSWGRTLGKTLSMLNCSIRIFRVLL